MTKFLDVIKHNPVRVLVIITAATALLARYVAGFPTDLVLGLAAAVLGVGGEVTRTQVTANPNVPKV